MRSRHFPTALFDLEKLEGIDTDLNVRPFSQKGVFTSLRQFSVNAMNHHHGMQAVERFGVRWTGKFDLMKTGSTMNCQTETFRRSLPGKPP